MVVTKGGSIAHSVRRTSVAVHVINGVTSINFAAVPQTQTVDKGHGGNCSAIVQNRLLITANHSLIAVDLDYSRTFRPHHCAQCNKSMVVYRISLDFYEHCRRSSYSSEVSDWVNGCMHIRTRRQACNGEYKFSFSAVFILLFLTKVSIKKCFHHVKKSDLKNYNIILFHVTLPVPPSHLIGRWLIAVLVRLLLKLPS